MSDVMTFPATFEEFAKTYKIVDSKQIYTNGTELIPIFRVKQWLEHKSTLNLTDKDKDIIKALELCFAEKGTKQTCGKCPYHKFGELCKVKRGRDTLDLINRQQAEIERLQNENKQFADIGKMYSEIKSEAIKEFAERLKPKLSVYDEVYVDNLVKEMVGEE